MTSASREPLLRADRRAQGDAADDHIHEHINWLAPRGEASYLHTTRTRTQQFLTSKLGHYAVLSLVSLDVSCIFADFIIALYVCDQKRPDEGWAEAQRALGIVSLVFSCLFMAELLAAIWAFGLPSVLPVRASPYAVTVLLTRVLDTSKPGSIASTPSSSWPASSWTSVSVACWPKSAR